MLSQRIRADKINGAQESWTRIDWEKAFYEPKNKGEWKIGSTTELDLPNLKSFLKALLGKCPRELGVWRGITLPSGPATGIPLTAGVSDRQPTWTDVDAGAECPEMSYW